MYLPKLYKEFSEKHPELLEAYQKLGKTCRETGPLDEKIQDLVNLGIAIGANSRGAVMSQTRKARASGSGREEIEHVVLLSLTTTGFPNMMAAMRWVDDVLKEDA